MLTRAGPSWSTGLKITKKLTCTIKGDGKAHWNISYESTLYLKAGGFETLTTSGQVGAMAYGELWLAVDGDKALAQDAVMRSNDPQEFAEQYSISHVGAMNLDEDGSFTLSALDENGNIDEGAEPYTGTFSEISDSWSGDDYQGGGINCEVDVYRRAAVVLAGSTTVDKPDTELSKTIEIEYYSYGALVVNNQGTSTSTMALA